MFGLLVSRSSWKSECLSHMKSPGSVWFSSFSGLFLVLLFLRTPLGSYIVPFAFGFVCACVCLGELTPSLCGVAPCLPGLTESDRLSCVFAVWMCVTLCSILCPSSHEHTLLRPPPCPELLSLHFLSLLFSSMTALHGTGYFLEHTWCFWGERLTFGLST